MITPTVGRVVWFYPGRDTPQPSEFVYHGELRPLAAIVTHVWNDQMVNLVVFDSNGNSHRRTSITLVQHVAPGSNYCEWMPYQKGQAAKTEQLEKTAVL